MTVQSHVRSNASLPNKEHAFVVPRTGDALFASRCWKHSVSWARVFQVSAQSQLPRECNTGWKLQTAIRVEEDGIPFFGAVHDGLQIVFHIPQRLLVHSPRPRRFVKYVANFASAQFADCQEIGRC